MLNLLRSLRVQGALFGLFCVVAVSSGYGQVTALDRQLSRIDVAVGAMGVITKGVSGANYLGQSVSEDGSTTVGALVQVRYTKKPLLGFEGTYSYARFTEQFTVAPGGVQTNASEYTLGYLAHLPTFLGVQPFASVGAGTTAFRPTPGGGQELPARGRLTVYYDIGVDDQLSKHFGARLQFRQAFYKAPDFDANYLRIDRKTFTSEPTFGFYVRF